MDRNRIVIAVCLALAALLSFGSGAAAAGNRRSAETAAPAPVEHALSAIARDRRALDQLLARAQAASGGQWQGVRAGVVQVRREIAATYQRMRRELSDLIAGTE